MIYIVTWLVITYSIVACPNNRPYTDDYGILHTPQYFTDQLCYDSDTTSHRKEFNSLEAAKQFIENVPVYDYTTSTVEIKEMKLDSVDVWMGKD